MHAPRNPFILSQLRPNAALGLLVGLLCIAACSNTAATQPTLSTGLVDDSSAGDLAAPAGDETAADMAAGEAGPSDAGPSEAGPAGDAIAGADGDAAPPADSGLPAADAAGETADAAAPVDSIPTPDATPPAPSGMVTIPGGTFAMGCVAGDTSCGDSEKPAHSVAIAPFYLDRYEVTASRYGACAQAGKCPAAYSVPDSCSYGKGWMDNYPINCVKFNEAEAFCAWDGGRLPSEAEWEFAARGGLIGKKFVWGDQAPTCTAGQANSAFWAKCTTFVLAPVGSVGTANGYGLYDMAGGVVEMVADWYSPTYYATSPSDNPKGPSSGTNRVARDLALAAENEDGVRVSKRGQMGLTEYDKYYGTGFRCARSLP